MSGNANESIFFVISIFVFLIFCIYASIKYREIDEIFQSVSDEKENLVSLQSSLLAKEKSLSALQETLSEKQADIDTRIQNFENNKSNYLNEIEKMKQEARFNLTVSAKQKDQALTSLSDIKKRSAQIDASSKALAEKWKNFTKYTNEKEAELKSRDNQQRLQFKAREILLSQNEKEAQRLIKIHFAKISDIPVLAKIAADIQHAGDDNLSSYLLNKKRPAPQAAAITSSLSKQNRVLTEHLKSLQYKCWLYESLVPYLSELDEDDSIESLNDIVHSPDYQNSDDRAKAWLSPEEYSTLSDSEKYQLALDRWWKRNRSKAEIGSDYERYIGYLMEQDGWHVIYNGINRGLQDMGIDLICHQGRRYILIQCKNWSSQKTIHEKHINQLFGSTVDFYLNQINKGGTFSEFYRLLQTKEILPLFVTSTQLSDTARRVASTLGVGYSEEQKFKPYPIIKCNIGSGGEKIYHLPFDQQYDRTEIKESGEFYATTIKEAESAGFRRAKRHVF